MDNEFSRFRKKYPNVDIEELRRLCVTFVIDHYHNRDSHKYVIGFIRRTNPNRTDRVLMAYITDIYALREERVKAFDEGVMNGSIRLPGYIQSLEETLK